MQHAISKWVGGLIGCAIWVVWRWVWALESTYMGEYCVVDIVDGCIRAAAVDIMVGVVFSRFLGGGGGEFICLMFFR